MAGGKFKPNAPMPDRAESRWLADIGELELWWFPYDGTSDPDNMMHTITAPRKRTNNPIFNYTRLKMNKDGNLYFADEDVVPTPYELCMLYAYFAPASAGAPAPDGAQQEGD